MFKSFDPKTSISGVTAIKSSIQRSIRSKLIEQFPPLGFTLENGDPQETLIDKIWPKKETLSVAKCANHLSLYILNGVPLFFQSYDEPYIPTLRVVHQYPFILPKVGVDAGAIKFILGGANVMNPGLLHQDGYLPPSDQKLEPGAIVAIWASGKKNACAIGKLLMGTEEIKATKKGHGIENITWLGDEFWKVQKI